MTGANRMRRIAGAAALLVGLGTAGGAHAQEGGAQGNAVIQSVGLVDHVVVLGDRSYRVSEGTVLEDKDGNQIEFSALPSLENGADMDAAAVYYEAAEGGASPQALHRLKLTGSVPR